MKVITKTKPRHRRMSTNAKSVILDGSLVIFTLITICCGLLPLILRWSNGQWTARRSTGVHVYGILLIVTVVIGRAWSLVNYISQEAPEDTRSAMRLVDMPLVCISLLIAIGTAKCRANAVLNLTQTIQEIKQNFGPFTYGCAKADWSALMIAILTVFLTIAISLVTTTPIPVGKWSANVLLYFIFFYLSKIPSLVMQIQFIYTMKLLVIRAECLILKLQSLKNVQGESCDLDMKYETSNTNKVSDIFAIEFNYLKKETKSKTLIKELKMISRAQERIRTAAGLLNTAFDAPLLLGLLLTVMYLTTMTASLIKLSISGHYTTFELCMQILSLLRHVWWVLALLETSHQIGQKDVLISSYQLDLLRDLSEREGANGVGIHEEVELERIWRWQEISTSFPLRISAFDICDLNRSLLGTISGAVTTYIVILMQVPG